MNYIEEVGPVFDNLRLHQDYFKIAKKFEDSILEHSALNLRKRQCDDDETGLTYGSGALVDKDGKYFESEASFDTYNGLLGNSYTLSVLKEIEAIAARDGMKIGRASYRLLEQRSCLNWHIDFNNTIRYHIPIQTNKGCMFVHENTVSRMDKLGALYTLNPHVPHTAINASRKKRVHIVVIAYREEDLIKDMDKAQTVYIE